MKSLILIGFVLLQSSFLFSQKGSDGADELINQGVKLHDQHDYEGAIAKYDEALELDPDNLTAMTEKAMTLYYVQKYEEAVEYCKEAIEKHPGDERLKMVYPIYANSLDTDGKPEDAIEIYDEGIALFPDYGQLHFNKGITQTGLKEYEDALISFETAAKIDPYHGSSHNAVARIQSVQNNKIPALLAYCRFAAVEPGGARALANMPYIDDILNGNVKKSGNSITINLDANSLPAEGDEKQANDFTVTEMIMSLGAALAKGNKKAVIFNERFTTVCSSLSELKDDNFGFYWEYYAPYFIEMHDEKLIETFSYILYAGTGEKGVSKWLKKNQSKVDKFYAWSKEYEWPSM
jgi:tetratricopeptide (TPR) repeat protein